jgi:thiaminase (transcriptional activator TenA)
MPERFTERLHRVAEPIWRAQHEHPFVRGIGDGSLDVERFAGYLRQDYLYMIDSARLFAVAASRAPDLDLMTRFVAFAHSTLTAEMELHRAYARKFGISSAELECTQASPTTRAYTDFMLRVASLGSFGELAVAPFPCMWGYSEIGQALARRERALEGRYAEWIETYSSHDFAELIEWYRVMVDRYAESAPEPELKRMEDVFLTSSRYEFLFWEMAWQQEKWRD